jgi:hypothetical protein
MSKLIKSQEKKIAEHLLSGKTITPIEALNLYGCFRLGARIHDLRNGGMSIETRTISDNGKRYAQYFMGSNYGE